MFRGILAALGLANFGLGLLAAIQPELVAGWIGFELQGPSALGEMRAVFGGAVCVVGILFIVAVVVPRPAVLLGALSVMFLALSMGRAASLFLDGWSLYTLSALGFEITTAALTAYLWRSPHLLDPEPDLESVLEAAASPASTPSPPSSEPSAAAASPEPSED